VSLSKSFLERALAAKWHFRREGDRETREWKGPATEPGLTGTRLERRMKAASCGSFCVGFTDRCVHNFLSQDAARLRINISRRDPNLKFHRPLARRSATARRCRDVVERIEENDRP